MAAIAQLKATDFQKIDSPFGYEHNISIWGINCNVTIYPNGNENADLSILLLNVQKCLQQINDTQKECFQSILDADMINLAEEWIADDEFKIEDETRECYLTEEGEKVFVPIAQQDFLSSIKLQSINFVLNENDENPLVELYLGCKPDYFFGHIILCRFMTSNPVLYKCCGLEG